MRGDPLLPFLAFLGCTMVCAMFIVPWRTLPGRARRLAHRAGKRVMAWAATSCDCQHCWNAREIINDHEWARYVDQHELRTRNRASS